MYDHATGVRDWNHHTATADASGVTFAGLILHHWPHIEIDLHAMGVDVESGILHQRSWSWLRLRIAATPTAERVTKGQ